jgi:hypothetical protein
MEKLIREGKCADVLSVSPRTLRYWRRRRIIPFLKVGALVMYDLDDVLHALKTFKREACSKGGEDYTHKPRKKTGTKAPAKP